jgi:hypothetical protein
MRENFCVVKVLGWFPQQNSQCARFCGKRGRFKFKISNILELNRLQFLRNRSKKEDFAPKRGIDKNGR